MKAREQKQDDADAWETAMEMLGDDYWSLGNPGYGQHVNWHLNSRGVPCMIRKSTQCRKSTGGKAPRKQK